MRWRAAILAAAALGLAAREARAADDDGVYDRMSGDLDVRVGAGVAVGQGGPSFAGALSLVYLQTLGLYSEYADAFGGDGPVFGRSIAAGVHLQPLFLARYAYDLERGPAHLDLMLDSLAFEVGTFWFAARDSAFAGPGLEIGLTGGVPVLPSASGPWVDVRAALRWRPTDLHMPGADPGERGAMLTVTVAWHQVARVHLVDAGDTLKR